MNMLCLNNIGIIFNCMKRMLILLMIILSFPFDVFSQPPVGSWTLSPESSGYSDEFNGSSLNTSKWNDCGICNPNWSWYYLNIASDGINNLSFGTSSVGGFNVIKLLTKQESPPLRKNCWNCPLKTYNYSSSMLSSKVPFQYGYYEINAKMSSHQTQTLFDFWFWSSQDSPIHNYSEIDVFEMGCSTPYVCPPNIHMDYDTSRNLFYSYAKCQDPCSEPNYGVDFSQAFHKFGINWEKDFIDLYIDGVLRQHLTDPLGHSDRTCTQQPWWCCPDWQSYPNLNLISKMIPQIAVIQCGLRDGGCGASIPYPDQTGDICEVDYFRYYRRNPIVKVTDIDLVNSYVTLDVKPYVVNTGVGNNFSYDIMPGSNATQLTHSCVPPSPPPCNEATSTFIVTGPALINCKEYGGEPPVQCNTYITLNQPLNNVYLCDNVQTGTFVANNIYGAGNYYYCQSHTATITSGNDVSCWTKNGAILGPGFHVQVGASLSINIIK
jgi:hypothetical protein